MGEKQSLLEKELEFNKMLVSEYLRWGSVDEAFRRNKWDLPVSVSGYYRVLDRWGIVRAAGPNNRLAEAIDFLEQLAWEKVPLERLYKRLPPSFQTSVVTLHRILHCVKEGITRRRATALAIAPFDDPERILIGRDVSTPRLEYGKPYGVFSLPMGFSKRNEAVENSILRVLQQEVFTRKTVDDEFPFEIIPENPKPFVYFDIADVRLSVYHLTLPSSLSSLGNFSSYKLRDFQFLRHEEIWNLRNEFRVGVAEISGIYKKYLDFLADSEIDDPVVEVAELNKNLLAFAQEDV